MPRRRVFKTRAECPGMSTDLGPTCNQRQMIGRMVTLEKSSSSGVNITLDGAIVGQLDAALGSQVAAAIERGQSFTAVIEKAYPIYNDQFKPTGAQLDIKVEYLLEKGQPAIEAPKCWRLVECSHEPYTTGSFFTKVAGVTFEGRQGIAAHSSEDEILSLLRDPNNPFDKGAIKVMRLNGEQLGFIPAHVSRFGDSSGLAFRMDRGEKYQCRIKNITGGGSRETIGVNIEITEGEKFDHVPQVHGFKAAPLLWILAPIIIIGCILRAVFK